MSRSTRSEGYAVRCSSRAISFGSWASLILLLAFSSMHCAVKSAPKPEINDDLVKIITASVCKQPNEPQRASLTALMSSVLPTSSDGRLIDQPPGVELPDGATAPTRPDLYPAAAWITGIYCSCWPELCIRAEATQ